MAKRKTKKETLAEKCMKCGELLREGYGEGQSAACEKCMVTKQKPVTLASIFPTWFGLKKWECTPSGIPVTEFNDKLKLALYKMRANDPEGIYRSNMAGTWHSKDTVLQELPHVLGEELVKIFHATMSAVANQHHADPNGEYKWKFNSWCMMYQEGGYATPHNHPNCHFSGVYYVDMGPAEEAELTMATGVRIQPGCFEALDVRGINAQIPGMMLQPAFRLDPKAGTSVAFPSWLPHFVHPFRGEGERICIPCNASIIKYTKKES
jgi:uncharacterized protein (TIGR02466 family)